MGKIVQSNLGHWPGLETQQNLFDAETYATLMKVILKTNFKETYQEKPDHYSHVFKSGDNRICAEGESYISNLEYAEDERTIDYLAKNITPIISNYLRSKRDSLRYFMIPQLMRLSPGSYLRTHVDDYAGEMGFTIFINDGWKWDYGGILTFISEGGESALPIFPTNNMALWRDESVKSFHYVTQQTKYSGKYQYLLVGWASDNENQSMNNSRRYVKI